MICGSPRDVAGPVIDMLFPPGTNTWLPNALEKRFGYPLPPGLANYAFTKQGFDFI